MGNSQSNEEHAQSPAGSRKGTPQPGSRHRDASRDAARKAPSSNVTKSAVLPFSSTGQSTSTASTATATATVSRSPVSTRTRARSINSPYTPKAGGDGSNSSLRSQNSTTEGKQRPSSRSVTVPPSSFDKDAPSPLSQPVAVAVPPADNDGAAEKDTITSPIAIESPFSLPASNYSRPPRLPLPIETEVHAPGSPIVPPLEVDDSAIDHHDIEGALPRRSSVLSSTTVDEEDNGDHEAFAVVDKLAPTVPTLVEWRGGGSKIYVTGTFVNWERKYKLSRDKEKPGFVALLQLKPGTHHIKFLVDGDMITSEDLPTTVDYTNILVNYIEVVAPLPPAEKQVPTPAEPIAIPGAELTAGQERPRDESQTREGENQDKDASTSALQDTLPDRSKTVSDAKQAQSGTSGHADAPQAQQLPKQKIPRAKYTSELPEYLHDLDVYINPEDERHQRVNRVISQLPQPPSLPMFMSKSILNGTTPHKDDASVLIMPNHTVLNHLATSSIKHGVLATSGTTRYKRKFLTTIMYKPTSDDG